MAERRQQFTDPALEARLRDLGTDLVWPPTPDLASSVRQRVAARPAPRGRRWLPSPAARRRLLTALALLLVAALFLGALPPVRQGIARRLGLTNVSIVHVPAVPTPTVAPPATPPPIDTPTATPSPSNTLARAGLGSETTRAEAQARVSYAIRTPSLPEYATPDEVHVSVPPSGGRVSLLYRARAGLPPIAGSDVGVLLQEFRGNINEGFFQKGVPPGSRVEPATVNGVAGYWIEGGLRFFGYTDASGMAQFEETRLAGNTLLWERDGIVYRLESSLSKDDALRVAASIAYDDRSTAFIGIATARREIRGLAPSIPA